MSARSSRGLWLIAGGWRLIARGALAAALVLPLGASAQQAPAWPAQPTRPGQMPVLPLTQLDDRALAADLDNRAFTVAFAQPVPIKVRCSSFSSAARV